MSEVLPLNGQKEENSSKPQDRANDKQEISKSVSEKVEEFCNLESIPEEIKHRLSQLICSYQIELENAKDQGCWKILFISLPWITIVWPIFILSISYFIEIRYNLFNSSIHFLPKSIPFISGFLIAMSVLLESILIIILASFFLLFIQSIFRAIFPYIIDRKVNKKHTIAVIINELISILSCLENGGDEVINMRYKVTLVFTIEKIAKCMERYLPLMFPSGDIVSDAWMKERFQQIAAALREKKKWILTPKEDTYDFLLSSLASTLISFVDDNWDALERLEQAKLTRSQLWNSIAKFILNAIKAIIIAGLPVAGFIIFQHTSFAFTGTTLVTITSILSIYVVYVVTSTLDPNFDTRLSQAKDFASGIIPGIGSKP